MRVHFDKKEFMKINDSFNSNWNMYVKNLHIVYQLYWGSILHFFDVYEFETKMWDGIVLTNLSTMPLFPSFSPNAK